MPCSNLPTTQSRHSPKSSSVEGSSLPDDLDTLKCIVAQANRQLKKHHNQAKHAKWASKAEACDHDEAAFCHTEQEEADEDPSAAAEEPEWDHSLHGVKRAHQNQFESEEEDEAGPFTQDQNNGFYFPDYNPPLPPLSPMLIHSKHSIRGAQHCHLNPSATCSLSSTPHTPSSSQSTPATSTATHLDPFTPWKPKDNSGKPAMNQHSSQSASILHAATSILCTFLATTDGTFASEDEMIWEIKQQIAQLHGELVKDTHALILGWAGFGLSLSLPAHELKAQVKFLLHNGHHVFGNVTNCAHPFANDIHVAIIGRRFFHSRHPLSMGLYTLQFNPIPLPLLALVMTAVECALRDWETGENHMKTNHFQH
ncbi:hypothetical protein K439DRAFT_1620542 [Ramaria rubella]|nr:hypothetical protein K439DRAFT_1620542 [Ramaria rubella]